MDFHPSDPQSIDNKGERETWIHLQKAFKDEEGIAVHSFNIANQQADILILHRELGLWVIECKGCRIDNIASIAGSVFTMRNWHSPTEDPINQARKQMFAIKAQLETRMGAANMPTCHSHAALPFISAKQWEEQKLSRNYGDKAEDLISRALTKRTDFEEKIAIHN